MRTLLIIALVSAAGAARAQGTYSPLVDIRDVDAACRGLAVVPADAKTPDPSLDAALSTASCLVTARTRGLVVAPTAESRAALVSAVTPAIRLFERVIAAGEPAHAVLAEYALADVFDGLADRLMSAVPPLSPQIGAVEVAEHDAHVAGADRLAEPLRRRAAAHRRALARLVVEHPDLVDRRDPVLAYAIAHARIVDAAGVARR